MPMTKKLMTKLRKRGPNSLKARGSSAAAAEAAISGTLRSMARRVMAMAMTASLKNTIRSNPSSSGAGCVWTSEFLADSGSEFAWLAVKTGWEARAAPALQFVEPAQLAKMYFGNDVAADRICPTALYSIARHTVYLSTAWNQDNLHDRSVLLHELVHHLQVLDKVKVDCPALYDRQAFHWQAVWLRAQGIRDPYAFLKLDEFMIYTMTSCPNYY